MRMEFIPDGSEDCPLIRLFDFDTTEAKQLRESVARLSNEEADQFAVHGLARGVSGCELVLCQGAWDQGMVQVGPQSFECMLTVGTWQDAAGLIAPFERGSSGYQWLVRGETSLLLSPSGCW